MSVDATLREVFAVLFPTAASREELRRGEVDGWDSLSHLELVSGIESAFSIRIDPEKALEIETFADARRIVADLVGEC